MSCAGGEQVFSAVCYHRGKRQESHRFQRVRTESVHRRNSQANRFFFFWKCIVEESAAGFSWGEQTTELTAEPTLPSRGPAPSGQDGPRRAERLPCSTPSAAGHGRRAFLPHPPFKDFPAFSARSQQCRGCRTGPQPTHHRALQHPALTLTAGLLLHRVRAHK